VSDPEQEKAFADYCEWYGKRRYIKKELAWLLPTQGWPGFRVGFSYEFFENEILNAPMKAMRGGAVRSHQPLGSVTVRPSDPLYRIYADLFLRRVHREIERFGRTPVVKQKRPTPKRVRLVEAKRHVVACYLADLLWLSIDLAAPEVVLHDISLEHGSGPYAEHMQMVAEILRPDLAYPGRYVLLG
jgi:hypothetical protein